MTSNRGRFIVCIYFSFLLQNETGFSCLEGHNYPDSYSGDVSVITSNSID